MAEFDPFDVKRTLYGCASWEEYWKPGIEGWGRTDAESYAESYVTTKDYDTLLALYCEAKGIVNPPKAYE